ncbi:MAG: YlbL family protein [Acidimicrobiia bacterium]
MTTPGDPPTVTTDPSDAPGTLDGVPPAPAPPPPPANHLDEDPPRSSRLGKVLVVIAVLLTVVGIAGSRITVPYVIFSPGDATPIDDYLHIKGAHTYRHRGGFLLLTVRVSNGRPNVWRFVQASLDDDSTVLGEKDYYGNAPRKRVNQQDVQAMADSQTAAQEAALTRLGYDVKVTGSGAVIAQVVPKSPAARAGLEPGDVITAIDGTRVSVREQVGAIVQARPAGTTFTVTVRRHDEDRTIAVTSATAPTGDLAGKPWFGIGAGTVDRHVSFPFDVKIDAGDVSGPSGGLAFALSIIDDLTPGNLSGGAKVAVTGEIDGEGHVGQVGGVSQKAVAASDAGAKFMIVPRAEVRDARTKAGSMPVFGVRTLDDALKVLHAHGGVAVPARAA